MRYLSDLLHAALLATSSNRPARLGKLSPGVAPLAATTLQTTEVHTSVPTDADPQLTNEYDGKKSPKPTVKKVISEFQEFYANLSKDFGAFKRVDDNRKFVFVSPPGPGLTWSDETVLSRDADLMEDGDSKGNLVHRIADRYGSSKPILLYLPGMDGTGISSASFQFDDLSKTFDFWRLSVTTDDRSSFGEMSRMVCDFVDELCAAGDGSRPIYLMGESFGGLLASDVAYRLQKRESRGRGENPLKGLVLVNPATSFDSSNWDILAPALTSLYDENTSATNNNDPDALPSTYATVGSLVLSSLVPSQNQILRLVDYLSSLPVSESESFDPSQIQSILKESANSFKNIEKRLPGPLVKHRVQNWLMIGSTFMTEKRLSEIKLPTLVVSGQDDAFLKSADEARRLKNVMPSCETLLIPKNGHFVMDNTVNITEAIIYSKLDPLKDSKPKYDLITDWKLPDQREVEEAFQNTVKPLEERFSPIYISTDSYGRRAFGLGNLPKVDGPILFVANHQLLGQDLNLFVPKLIQNGFTVRGLAHPLIFSGTTRSELGGRTPGILKRPTQRDENTGRNNMKEATNGLSVFQKFGAVQVNPKNYYRLMETGQNALLFPGGTREVFHGKDEAYKLFWPKKVDFVRTAARFNATIIPISAVGMADSVNYALSSEQLSNAPFFGDFARQFSNNITAARFDMSAEEEFFSPPLVIPSQPSRNYFVFGTPTSTTDLDPKDREGCRRVYEELQDEMNRGFKDVLQAREKDIFKDARPRQAYEQFFRKQAPTFSIDEMNR